MSLVQLNNIYKHKSISPDTYNKKNKVQRKTECSLMSNPELVEIRGIGLGSYAAFHVSFCVQVGVTHSYFSVENQNNVCGGDQNMTVA